MYLYRTFLIMMVFFLITKTYSNTLLLRVSLEAEFIKIFLTVLPVFCSCLFLNNICHFYVDRHSSQLPKDTYLCAFLLPHNQKAYPLDHHIMAMRLFHKI